ncbi:cytochrome P450 [Russula earlei]|uniref:Cytochrome P450 n=1 Tax=Russula earlei TaxID=71964 RepID=A0ACC0TUK8_9AGAM|nr:cytochrome P450 [Russula earlei]
MPTVLSVILPVSGLFLISLLLQLRRVARSVGNLAGLFFLIGPNTDSGELIARIAPSARYLTPGTAWMQKRKYRDFAAAGKDAISLVNLLDGIEGTANSDQTVSQVTAFPWPKSDLLLADAAAIKEVTTLRAKFPKPVYRYAILTVFGPNIVASEGAQWKKYRKITAPPFSEKNYKFVWDETIHIVTDLFDSIWRDKSSIVVDHCLDITLPLALFIIGAAEVIPGFGRRMTWTSDLVVPPGYQMAFKDALHILSSNLSLYILLPRWARNLTKLTKEVHLASVEVKKYMLEMVQARRNADKAEERHDLFSGLLDAARHEQDDGTALTKDELIGNMFIFLLAGHETTAHTLCFTFALLALHPDEQERLYEQNKGVIASLNGIPMYEDMGRFTYSFADLQPIIRYDYKIVSIPKIAAGDTILTVNNIDGGKTTVPVPSGTDIELNVSALHYNPRYWKDPHRFIPERFLGDWPKDAFIPFSQGARACIGRRFFETESVAIMTMLVSNYRIEVKEEPEFAGETFEERYARVTAFDHAITTL